MKTDGQDHDMRDESDFSGRGAASVLELGAERVMARNSGATQPSVRVTTRRALYGSARDGWHPSHM